MRRILVTSALPNANGAIHLGHMLEHIQTDIWVRFQRMMGNQCIYVCPDDTHGTATMLAAEREAVTPEVLIERLRAEHAEDFRRFHVSHDNYYSTHSPENEHYNNLIYTRPLRAHTFTADVESATDTPNVESAQQHCGWHSSPGVPRCSPRRRASVHGGVSRGPMASGFAVRWGFALKHTQKADRPIRAGPATARADQCELGACS